MGSPGQDVPAAGPRGRAWLELIRAPNLLTAWGDPVAGALWAGVAAGAAPRVALATAGVCAIYAAGMILNDVFDRAEDARDRPARPIPSGRIALRHAALAGAVLLALGPALGAAAGAATLAWMGPLAVWALLYDVRLKRTPLGPALLGLCRTVSVLAGAAAAGGWTGPARAWPAAALVGLYVAWLSVKARNETRDPHWPPERIGRWLGALPWLQGALCALAPGAGRARAMALIFTLLPALHRRARRTIPAS
jgi:4-hydroxybenzoate polyprenyltransferase